MNDVQKFIQDRRSVRLPLDPHHPIAEDDLRTILEAGRWAPTPHNMQNYEIIIIDDRKVLEMLGNMKSSVSETFLRENYEQLSFSEEELRRRKVGILGLMFPPSFRDPQKFREVAEESPSQPLSYAINGSTVLLIMIYDSRKRAPDSEGDVLGLVGLGCVMENMWLMATSLGISVRILSDFGDKPVDEEVKRVLDIPDYMNVVYGLRLGYPISPTSESLRVRRDLDEFTHRNGYGNKGFE
ncbi:MAG: nitroreductase family protein [Methanomassiliicoccales archaeon]|jgi:nitroreductase